MSDNVIEVRVVPSKENAVKARALLDQMIPEPRSEDQAWLMAFMASAVSRLPSQDAITKDVLRKRELHKKRRQQKGTKS